MITEDYVSYESAKLLKEKGFEYNPDESYWLIDADNKMYWISRIGAYDYVDTPTESFQRPKNGYRLITQAMAMKWLREIYKLEVRSTYDYDKDLWWGYINPMYEETDENSDIYQKALRFDYPGKSYEEAAEAAIKYCLENLI